MGVIGEWDIDLKNLKIIFQIKLPVHTNLLYDVDNTTFRRPLYCSELCLISET